MKKLTEQNQTAFVRWQYWYLVVSIITDEQVTNGCHTATPLSPCTVFQQSSESEVHFDVEIAIKVLRQAGYHSHAVFLAEKHMHHEWYLKIQLEDLKVKTCKQMYKACQSLNVLVKLVCVCLFPPQSTVTPRAQLT